MDALVIGKPNTGKTLFVINFAAYLGLKEIRLDARDNEGRAYSQRLTLDRARRNLVSDKPHKTLMLQTLSLDLAFGKGKRHITMVDSIGIQEGIHQDVGVRRSMAMTLERLSHAEVVMHLVDASSVDAGVVESPGAVDDEIFRFGRLRGPYALIANKMDKSNASEGLRWLKDHFHEQPPIPSSAVTQRGFREVRSFVYRHLS